MNHMSTCDQKRNDHLNFQTINQWLFLGSKDVIIHFWHVTIKDGKT